MTEREPIVNDDFDVPTELVTDNTVLRPLGPEHNESDYEAWTTSIDFIGSLPGFPDGDWPSPMPLSKNLDDLVRHRSDFDRRVGFTFTVLDKTDESTVVGCLYIYGDLSGEYPVEVQSWVRASRAELDSEVRAAVIDWLRRDWPWPSFRYDSVE